MSSLIRSTALTAAALMLAACGGGETTSTTTNGSAASAEGRTAFERPDDHAMGNPNAAVTVVEYASVSCGACAVWHNTVFPEFKEKYIDTGKVRYVFREFVAGQAQMADAGFKIALCVPEEKYFENIGLQFKRQAQLFEFAQRGQLREAYVSLAKASGLSEQEFVACVGNTELRDQYMARMQEGLDIGIGGTPAFVINGQKSKGSMEELSAVIDPLLEANGG